jgi:hypothetical protein
MRRSFLSIVVRVLVAIGAWNGQYRRWQALRVIGIKQGEGTPFESLRANGTRVINDWLQPFVLRLSKHVLASITASRRS